MFAAQFEPDGVGFVYRNHTIGDPIPVSAAERNRYLADFAKFTKYGAWTMLAGALILLVAFLLYSFMTKAEVPDLVSLGSFGVMIVLYMAAYLRAWNKPVRELKSRR